MIKSLKQMMNGKTSYHERNIVYVEIKIQSHHSREFIGTVRIKGLTNAHVAV